MPFCEGKLLQQTSWNTTEETQMTAEKEKVRAENEDGRGIIVIIIILFTTGKRHV